MPHESMAAAFSDAGPSRRADKFEAKRSAEETAEFEKAFAQRGASLLQEQAEQKFAGHEEEIERARKRRCGPSDMWGMSAQEQEGGGGAQVPKAQRRAFDPEKDLEVTKSVSREEFASLVE